MQREKPERMRKARESRSPTEGSSVRVGPERATWASGWLFVRWTWVSYHDNQGSPCPGLSLPGPLSRPQSSYMWKGEDCPYLRSFFSRGGRGCGQLVGFVKNTFNVFWYLFPCNSVNVYWTPARQCARHQGVPRTKFHHKALTDCGKEGMEGKRTEKHKEGELCCESGAKKAVWGNGREKDQLWFESGGI